MNYAEAAKMLECSENYLRTHWWTVVDRCQRRHIELTRSGRGANVRIGIKMPGDEDFVYETKEKD